jgi:hypothetical protein
LKIAPNFGDVFVWTPEYVFRFYFERLQFDSELLQIIASIFNGIPGEAGLSVWPGR